LLGIAVVLTLWGVLMFGLAVFRASHFVWSRAIIAFLVGLVSWIIAVIVYSTWLQLRECGEYRRERPCLTPQRLRGRPRS
jgi:hypothetical protein